MGRAGLASEEGHHLPPTWRVLQDLRQGGSGASCQCQLEEGRLGQGWARGERSLCFTQRGAHRMKSGPALAQLSSQVGLVLDRPGCGWQGAFPRGRVGPSRGSGRCRWVF